jgi:acyl-CoA synthetase (AMP-forming)/AMP-acid ligase II
VVRAWQVGKVAKTFAKNKKKTGASNGYGLTETNGGICSIALDEFAKRPTSCGQAQPLVDVLVAEEGAGGELLRLAKLGARGELLIRGSLVMRGYWNKPQKTTASLVAVRGEGAGWFRSGDVATVDADGFIHIVDRIKDLIIRGGENISCAVVESAFYSLHTVMECAAFGLADKRLGERVGLCVVVKPSAASPSAAELLRHVVDGKLLASFKVPLAADVFVQREQLTRGETGKILKREIREHFNAKAVAPRSKL